MQNILNEIRIFLTSILDWFVLMLFFTVFFFSFNVGTVELFGRLVTFPIPANPSFVAELFSMMVRDIVPAGIPLVVTAPLTAFVAQIKLSLFLAFIFTSPFLLYRVLKYLAPALYRHEQSLIYKVIFPSVLLFVGGSVFAYIIIIPETFRVLYTFTAPIGSMALLGVNEFVGLTLSLMIVTGVVFTLPVLMVLLTLFGAVSSAFWWQRSRYALISFLIVSAIITPDGSGISMVLLALPVSALYSTGAFVCSRVEAAKRRGESTLPVNN